MANTFPLQQLHAVSETRADTAAANLGTLIQHLQRQQAKLALLLRYRDEYRQRLREAKQRGLDGLRLRNFHDFIERLELALTEQRTTIAEAEDAVARGRDEWRSLETRSKALDTLSQRFDNASRRKAAQAEQKQQDAHAARLTGGRRLFCL